MIARVLDEFGVEFIITDNVLEDITYDVGYWALDDIEYFWGVANTSQIRTYIVEAIPEWQAKEKSRNYKV